jgi:hypothetical protein
MQWNTSEERRKSGLLEAATKQRIDKT